MFFCFTGNNSSSFFKLFDDELVCISNIHSFISGNFFCKVSIFIQRNNWIIWLNDFLSHTYFIIFLTKSRSTMNYTRTSIICHKLANQYFKASIFFSIQKEIKHWHILNTFESTSLKLLNYFIILLSLHFLLFSFIKTF